MTTPGSMARTISSMVGDHDTAEALAHLVMACVQAYPAAAVAVLVRDQGEDLELLSSSSHRADELELLQIQCQEGPCVDAIRSGTQIRVSGRAELEQRWSTVGQAIAEAGYTAVHAYPMVWRGNPIGGLNIFLTEDEQADPVTGQMYADLATLAVVQANDLSADHLLARVHEAVLARTVIEQAKGVLAYQRGIDLDTAYSALREQADQQHETVTAAAARVVNEAYRS